MLPPEKLSQWEWSRHNDTAGNHLCGSSSAQGPCQLFEARAWDFGLTVPNEILSTFGLLGLLWFCLFSKGGFIVSHQVSASPSSFYKPLESLIPCQHKLWYSIFSLHPYKPNRGLTGKRYICEKFKTLWKERFQGVLIHN